jgi:hypothetical protein
VFSLVLHYHIKERTPFHLAGYSHFLFFVWVRIHISSFYFTLLKAGEHNVFIDHHRIIEGVLSSCLRILNRIVLSWITVLEFFNDF